MAQVEYGCTCGRSELPLLLLYACPHCLDVKCPRCVREEVVCYYCPACLIETPSATFKSGRGRCTRQCFRCPICATTLNVVANADDTALSLACGVCRWASAANVDADANADADPAAGQPLVAPRVADLVTAVQRREISERAQSDFDRLRHAFDDIAIALTLPSNTATTAAAPPPAAVGAAADAATAATLPSAVPDVPSGGGARPTLAQRQSVPGVDVDRVRDVNPERVPLVARLSKRCRACEHNVVKPEAKAQSVKFMMNLSAYLMTLRVTVMQLPPTVTDNCELVLRFLNPSDQAVEVVVQSAVLDEGGQVQSPLPRFKLAGYNELLEFDDVEAAASLPEAEIATGVIAKHGNWATARLRIVGTGTRSAGLRPPHATLVLDVLPAADDSGVVPATAQHWKPLTVHVRWPSTTSL